MKNQARGYHGHFIKACELYEKTHGIKTPEGGREVTSAYGYGTGYEDGFSRGRATAAGEAFLWGMIVEALCVLLCLFVAWAFK